MLFQLMFLKHWDLCMGGIAYMPNCIIYHYEIGAFSCLYFPLLGFIILLHYILKEFFKVIISSGKHHQKLIGSPLNCVINYYIQDKKSKFLFQGMLKVLIFVKPFWRVMAAVSRPKLACA